MRRARVRLGLTFVLAALGCLVFAQDQQRPAAPTFRSRISVVPIDVRVIDAKGNPVTGVKAADFIVQEDGVPQQIRHFEEYALSPEPSVAPDVAPTLRGAPEAALAPQKARIFLFVLGRGRLKEPAKALDALVRFVRDDLLPQDQAAVIAWNRATSFTTDHQKVLRTVERFRDRHEQIEALIGQRFSGLQAMYGSREYGPAIQKAIDEVFYGPGAAPARRAAAAAVPDAARMAEDLRRDADTIQRAEIVSTHQIASPFDESATRDAERFGVSLEQFMADAIQRDQDLNNLYTGLEYLRYLEGEKRLVFLTHSGIYLDRLEQDLSLAAMANDARVALDIVQTGGLAGLRAPSLSAGAPPLMQQVATTGSSLGNANVREGFAFQTLRTLSSLTGGVSSVASIAAPAFDRINEVTRTGYRLGYYPTNDKWDGKYRRIDVKMRRPGLTVMFRHGYYGRDAVVPLDRKAFITFNRVAAAGGYDRELKDLPVKAKVSVVPAEVGTGQEAIVEATIDVSRVTFVQRGDRRVASLDVDVFCGDDKEKVIGESWKKAELALKAETYTRVLREGLVWPTRLPIKGRLRYVKIVVYDYASDLVGTAMITVK